MERAVSARIAAGWALALTLALAGARVELAARDGPHAGAVLLDLGAGRWTEAWLTSDRSDVLRRTRARGRWARFDAVPPGVYRIFLARDTPPGVLVPVPVPAATAAGPGRPASPPEREDVRRWLAAHAAAQATGGAGALAALYDPAYRGPAHERASERIAALRRARAERGAPPPAAGQLVEAWSVPARPDTVLALVAAAVPRPRGGSRPLVRLLELVRHEAGLRLRRTTALPLPRVGPDVELAYGVGSPLVAVRVSPGQTTRVAVE